ncbi:MAG: hypothetical protein KGL95_08010, partial [Patescibacteria group bacterium]|nr:hypothetical protein [Patescibacteria group bacterium]
MPLGETLGNATRVGRLVDAIGGTHVVRDHFRGVRPLSESILKPQDILRSYAGQVTRVPTQVGDQTFNLSYADIRSLEASTAARNPQTELTGDNERLRAANDTGRALQALLAQGSSAEANAQGAGGLWGARRQQKRIRNGMQELQAATNLAVNQSLTRDWVDTVTAFNAGHHQLDLMAAGQRVLAAGAAVAVPLFPVAKALSKASPLLAGGVTVASIMAGKFVSDQLTGHVAMRKPQEQDRIVFGQLPKNPPTKAEIVTSLGRVLELAAKLDKDVVFPGGLALREQIATPKARAQLLADEGQVAALLYSLVSFDPNYLQKREPISAYENLVAV